MSDFSPAWLALREPIDARSRAGGLAAALRSVRGARRVVDLGCGTGANLRYLAPRIGGSQEWLLVDRDRTLLEEASARIRAWALAGGDDLTPGALSGAGDLVADPATGPASRSAPGSVPRSASGTASWTGACGAAECGLPVEGAGFGCRIRLRELDLASGLDRLEPEAADLVTASALLDLVSERWLRELAARCAAGSAELLIALTYDGSIRFDPADPEDERVRRLVNRHQLTDKGFGPALGPTATAAARRILEAHGYRVRTSPSPWRIQPREQALQHALVHGWVDAARRLVPGPSLRGWAARRGAHIDAGRSWLSLGHHDLLASPP